MVPGPAHVDGEIAETWEVGVIYICIYGVALDESVDPTDQDGFQRLISNEGDTTE